MHQLVATDYQLPIRAVERHATNRVAAHVLGARLLTGLLTGYAGIKNRGLSDTHRCFNVVRVSQFGPA